MMNVQLGFDALLTDAAADNAARTFDRETAHLPGIWVEAPTYYRQQIEDHHAGIPANNFDAAIAIRKEAHLLARKLTGGNPGILAGDDALGCKLDVECAAPDGEISLWRQGGVFEVKVAGTKARVEMGGMFGIGATAMPYLGFSVRAVDETKPFLSNTGSRSFVGCYVALEPGMTTDNFVQRILSTHVSRDLGGRLVSVHRNFH